MRRITYFTNNKNFQPTGDMEGIALYIFYIKDRSEINRLIETMNPEEYIIDLDIEEMLKELCL